SFHGRKLLDVGCGPTVHNVFPATKKMDNIVLSDFLPQNRLAVEKWIQKAPDAIDWSFLSEPAATIEGYTDVKSGAKEIEERTRRAIRKVIPCDVLNPQVLPEDHKESFDVVLTSLCLTGACVDKGTYQKAVQNIGNLVGQGGYLIMCDVRGIEHYWVAEAKFPVFPVSSDQAKEALSHAGFEIERCSLIDRGDDTLQAKDTYAWQQAFVILARKL
ncbi:unnamed protein product, partial [Ixodes hexagonus]